MPVATCYSLPRSALRNRPSSVIGSPPSPVSNSHRFQGRSILSHHPMVWQNWTVRMFLPPKLLLVVMRANYETVLVFFACPVFFQCSWWSKPTQHVRMCVIQVCYTRHDVCYTGEPCVGYCPKWFVKEEDSQVGGLVHHFTGEYWTCKEKQDWSRCPDVFLWSFVSQHYSWLLQLFGLAFWYHTKSSVAVVTSSRSYHMRTPCNFLPSVPRFAVRITWLLAWSQFLFSEMMPAS